MGNYSKGKRGTRIKIYLLLATVRNQLKIFTRRTLAGNWLAEAQCLVFLAIAYRGPTPRPSRRRVVRLARYTMPCRFRVCPFCDQMRQTVVMGLSVPFSIGLIFSRSAHFVRHKTKQKSLPPDTFSGLKIATKYVLRPGRAPSPARRDYCAPQTH